jgi:DNA-binding GntR family transcriptional regulator
VLVKDVFSQVDRSSLYETVHSQIALALIEGQLQPDDKVRIRALADQLGVSVTPVRDALLRLVKQGALEMRGLKDIRVPRMRVDQLQEIRMIRLRLEGLAAQLAASRIDRTAEVLLSQILEENETARTNGDTVTAVKLNRLFHSKIAAIAGLPTLQDMIEGMWLRMGPLIAAVYVIGGRAMISYHYEILDALRKRDPAAAETAIQADINATAEILLQSGLLRASAPEKTASELNTQLAL